MFLMNTLEDKLFMKADVFGIRFAGHKRKWGK